MRKGREEEGDGIRREQGRLVRATASTPPSEFMLRAITSLIKLLSTPLPGL